MQVRKTIAKWDDWTDYFNDWRGDIGIELPEAEKFIMTPLYDDKPSKEVEFGDFAGQSKWERITQVPNQQMKDSLLALTFVQGDTEFASVEQQRRLLNSVPHDYDRYAAVRVMLEEMRHGVQMAHVLVEHFGNSGKLEARKLLERRAREAFPEAKNPRLLGAFNQSVDNWLDFYAYTCFVDRDGKYQLGMLAPSGFAPLSRSAGPMLMEEAFHLGSGNDGLVRIIKAGKVPTPLIQKFFNKWISTALDLFGKDESSTAEWGYVWGIKARFDETKQRKAGNMDFNRKELNHHNRTLYWNEVNDIIRRLNGQRVEGQPELIMPDIKFHREIGQHAEECWSVTGEKLTEEEYAKHLLENLPQEADLKQLKEITKDPDWIQDKKIPDNPWDYQKRIHATCTNL